MPKPIHFVFPHKKIHTEGQVFFPDSLSSIDVLIKRVTGTAETSTNISVSSTLVTHKRRVLLEKN